MASLGFRVLGEVGAFVDGVERRLRPMERTLLAVLLAEHNRPVSTDQLLERIWRGQPPRTGRTAVRVHVERLRQAMRSPDVARLVSVDGGYRIVVEPGELDSDRFESAVRAGRRLREQDPVSAVDLLRGALAEWHGVPFGAMDDIPGIDVSRASLQRRYDELLVMLAEAELTAGHHGAVLADLTSWCLANPYTEALAAALCTALYRCGDQVSALQTCRTFRQRLRDDMGLDPTPAFMALESDVLNQALDPPPRVQALPRIRAHARLGLCGRDREIDRVLTFVDHPPGRGGIVAVIGRSGVGTSAILGEVRARLANSVLVRCSPDHPLAALQQIEDALGIEVPTALPGQPAEHHAIARAKAIVARLEKADVSAILLDDVFLLQQDEAAVLRRVLSVKPAYPAFVTAGRGLSAQDNPLLADTGTVQASSVVEVGPLRDSDASAVVSSIVRPDQVDDAELIGAIVATGNGDALVLSGIARNVSGGGTVTDLPATVSEFVARAVASLAPGHRLVLGCAAIAGVDPIDVMLVGDAAAVSYETAVAAAEFGLAAGILQERADGLSFRHQLFRDSLRIALSTARRAAVHAQLGQLLIGRGCADVPRVAAHLRSAGPGALVAEATSWTMREARELLAAGAPVAAAERAALAGRLGRTCGAPVIDIVESALLESDARARVGDVNTAQSLASTAAGEARQAGLRSAFVSAAVLATGPLLPAGLERQHAAALTAEGLDITEADGSPGRVALIEAWVRSRVLAEEQTSERSLAAIAAELEAASAQAADPYLRCLAYRGRYNLSWRQSTAPADRLPLSAGLSAAAARAGQPMLRLEGLRMQVCDYLDVGDAHGVAASLDIYRGQAADLASPLHHWWSAVLSATDACVRGDRDAELSWLAAADQRSSAVDAEIVLVSLLERTFARSVRHNDYATFVGLVSDAELGELGSDPLVALARLVIEHRLGIGSDVAQVRRLWQPHMHGPYAAPASALAVLALPSELTDPPTRGLAEALISVLGRSGGGLCYLNGAGCLGPVDSYLALLHDGLRDSAGATWHRARAERLTSTFAHGWAGWTHEWENAS